jgi:phosphomannomutase
MVTASHNPPEWNGFKLCREKGLIVGQGFGMEELKEVVKRKKFVKPATSGKRETYGGIIGEYSRFILDKIKFGRKLRVVLDTGNGTTGMIAPKLFRQLGCEVTVLNEELDGRFPYRSPEPTPEALQQLRSEVKKTGADFGVGYDGDGDRSVFVDDKGRILTGDIVSIIFAKALIKKAWNKVVYDVSCSLAVEESIRASGGVPVVEKVGRPFMMERVLRENAIFGGERSGHFYFLDIYGIDDGTYASLKMAEIISKGRESLSQMVDAVPQYYSSTVNMACSDEHKFKVTEKTKEFFEKLGYKIVQIDGVKAYDEEGWVLMRPSNTEPLIRVFVEGKTKRKHEQLLSLARKVLKEEIEKAA